ncbi:WYL domain-containing protein [Cohnella rhizosphaerae]|uniref:WYL domain-containing protein n=1 Tax=Cohnella rhizosphaerae TaxID=1457232 RepID=A0A9X4KTK8_9BACL|nr:WYL domain-containing protein [Cohnella rhizosphaerae]MDG0810560.1 WYL domain-containing protein [Cohnella rhizosphaerae]
MFGHKELAYVLEKLNAIHREDGSGIAADGKFAVDLSLNQGNESLRGLLGLIETAMNASRYLAFQYADRAGRLSARQVEPYQVVFKESSWYLQGYCVERADYRIFKLARMSGLRVLEGQFATRDFKPLPMDGGEWMSREEVAVKIRVHRSVVDRVIERFGESHVLEMGEETCLAAYPIVNDSFGYDKLLAFGDKCEVLEPPEVRLGFREYVRRIMDKYRN